MGYKPGKQITDDDIVQWGKKRDVKKLIQALDDYNSYVQSRAAWAIAQIDAKHAVKPLLETLKKGKLETRKWAAQLLGSYRDKATVEPLIAALDDDDGNMRLITAKALSLIGDPRAIAPLKAELEKKRPHDYAARDIQEAIAALEKGEFVPDKNKNEKVKVTIKISGAMHGRTDLIGTYSAEVPLDLDGPALLNSLAKSIIWQGEVRFYTGYQLSCRKGTLRSDGGGSIQKPTTLREACVQAGDTLEFYDWGGSFM